MLTIDSKSENDDLKREMESIKAPSAVCGPHILYDIFLILTTTSRPPTLEASPKTLLHLCTWHALVPPKGLTAQLFASMNNRSDMLRSDDYWKLYENYTGALKKIAEVQDTLETTKRDLSDTQAERKSDHSGPTCLRNISDL